MSLFSPFKAIIRTVLLYLVRVLLLSTSVYVRTLYPLKLFLYFSTCEYVTEYSTESYIRVLVRMYGAAVCRYGARSMYEVQLNGSVYRSRVSGVARYSSTAAQGTTSSLWSEGREGGGAHLQFYVDKDSSASSPLFPSY